MPGAAWVSHLTPEGAKSNELIRPGDWVLSASEFDPEAPLEPRQVEEVFTNVMPLLHVQVGGQTIRTTTEHPFYVRGKGWAAAKDLQTGDSLRSHDGQWVAVESVAEGDGLAAVYNLRVADYHTYFVGGSDWGFSVWAHNACFRDPAQKAAFLDNLLKSGKAPNWMKPWLSRGLTPPGYNVDHILPLSVGGADTPANMRLLLTADHRLWHRFYHPWR